MPNQFLHIKTVLFQTIQCSISMFFFFIHGQHVTQDQFSNVV